MIKVFSNTPKLRARVLVVALAAIGAPAMADVVGTVGAPTFEFIVNYTDAAGAAKSWTGGSAIDSSYFTLNQATGAWDLTRDWTASIAGGLVTLTLKADGTDGNLDPFVNYSFQATNISGAPVTFQTSASAPILGGVAGPNQVRASIAYALTDPTGNGATLTPLPAVGQDSNNGPETQIFRLSNSASPTVPGVNNASWVNAGVDVGQSYTKTGFPTGFYSDADGFIAGPVATGSTTWNWLQTRTRFSLTGNGDSVGISGFAEIVPVPEPGEWAMMSVGLGLVGAVAARRSKQSAAAKA